MKLDKLTVLKILGIAGAAIFFYWALQNLSLLADAAGWLLNILWPLLLGFCMAFVLNIPMRFFERHLLKNPKNKRAAALRRPLCILLSLLAIIVILTAVFALVVPELLSAFAVLGEAIPEFLTAAQKWALEGADRFPQAEQWLASLQIDWNETGKKLLSYVTEGAGNLLGGTVSVLSGIVGGVFNAIMAFIFALYILLGKEKLKSQTARVCVAFLPRKWADSLFFVANMASRTFAKFVSGQCTEACILGTLCWLGMSLLRLPYAPMIGALVGITALIPIVGAWVGLIVGAFMIGMESLTQALIFVIFLLVLQQVEGNLIYPRVVGSSVGLPPIWVLAAVTVGGSLWGIAGMLFAVPVCSILHALLRLGVHRRLEAQALQNGVGGYMGQHGGQGVARHLDSVTRQAYAAPEQDTLPAGLPLQKQPDDLIDAEIRHKAARHTEDGQHHRGGHLPPAGRGEGQQDAEPGSLLHTQHSSQRKIVVVCLR